MICNEDDGYGNMIIEVTVIMIKQDIHDGTNGVYYEATIPINNDNCGNYNDSNTAATKNKHANNGNRNN